MSLEFRTRTTVPESGVIVLPEEYRGAEVSITVRPVSKRNGPMKTKIEETSMYAFKGLLKGRTDEDVENAKLQYLKEKYIHDNDLD